MIANETYPSVRHSDRHLAGAVVAILAVTIWRVCCLTLNNVDIYVDEAQYWLWGQEPAFGYFSKPPLIGWVIRLFNEVGQSDSAFWIRLPGVLGHGVTGLILSFVAREVWQSPMASWAGLAYVTLPGVAVLSLFVSTDDLVLPCYAGALLALVHLHKRQSTGWASVLGIAFGLGLLSKYAMIYGVALAVIAQFIPRLQVNWRDFLLALCIAGALVVPNILWNSANGFITFGHTADNAGWQGIAWNWSNLAEFVGIQVFAFGLVFGPAYLLAIFRAAHAERAPLFLLFFSLPIFFAVSVQSVIEAANGNWAAPGFAAGVALVSGWLLTVAPRIFWIGLAVNALVSVVVPLSTVWPERMILGGKSIYARALGMHDFGTNSLEKARSLGVSNIVALDRAILAELTYQAQGTDIAVFSVPPQGVPANHYAFTRAVSETDFPALYVARTPLVCASAQDVGEWVLRDTRRVETSLRFFLLKQSCWQHKE